MQAHTQQQMQGVTRTTMQRIKTAIAMPTIPAMGKLKQMDGWSPVEKDEKEA